MKKQAFILFTALTALSVPLFAQTVDPCTQNTKLSGGTALTMNGNQGTGTLSGTSYHYEIWVDQGGARGASLKWFGANQGGGAAYRAEWTNPDDYLGRIGYYWGNGGPYTQYKNIYVDFNYTRSGRSTAGDYSYIGIYGWTRNPLVEYYIVEDWFGNQWQADTGPLGTSTTGGSVVGSFTVDGGTYDIIKSERVNKPSIDGNQTFTQVFSVRKTLRKCGTISVTEHFKKWKSLNLPFGDKMYEAKFLTEAGGGTGWLELSYLKLSQEDSPRGSVSPSSSAAVSSSAVASSSSRASSSSAAELSSSSEEVMPIKLIRPLSRVEFRVISFKGALQVESHASATIKVYNIDGNEVLKFNAPAGESIVQISLTPGIYIVKNVGNKKAQKVMIK